MKAEKAVAEKTPAQLGVPTVAELRNSYAPKAASERNGARFIYWIVRPLSFYLTVPVMALGVSANQVTFGGLFLGLVAVGMFSSGNRSLSLMACIPLAIWILADFVDGNIARYYQRTSHYGNFLDAFAETTVGVFLPIGLASGLALRPDAVMQALSQEWAINVIWIMAAIWSALTALIYQLRFRIKSAKLQVRLQLNQVVRSEADSSAPNVTATVVGDGRTPIDMPSWIETCFRRVNEALDSERSVINFALPLFVFGDIISVFIALRCLTTVISFVVSSAGFLRYAQLHLRVKRVKV